MTDHKPQPDRLWRSLNELAGTQEFRDSVEHEFPWHVTEEVQGMNRRDFWRLMGASLGLAGLTGCTRQPTETIVPYVSAPEEIIPGKPLFFATAMPSARGAMGLLVESHEGHPTKIEGNPRHPASLGATDTFSQASILTLYDPDRSQAVNHLGRISNWLSFLGSLNQQLGAQGVKKGAGLRILTETVTSPTLAWQLQSVLQTFPAARWHQYEPAAGDAARAGSQLAFGQFVNACYRLDKADVILALDADFLLCGLGNVRYAREFARRRYVAPGQATGATVPRLYAVESAPSNTGAAADHRLPMRAGQIEGFARAVAAAIGVGGQPASSFTGTRWITALVRDLLAHRGSSLIAVGDAQPAAVHALAHAINHALGNAGNTVIYTDPYEAQPVNQLQSLRELVAEMKAGQVEMLLILGGNPVFTAPADLDFAGGLNQVQFRAHLSLYQDETSALCHWHVPEAHYLESWSDARAYDGTASIVQPLIAPLYDGRSTHQLLSAVVGQPERSAYDLVREYWQTHGGLGGGNFEKAWRVALEAGVIAGTALPPKQVTVKPGLPAPSSNASSNAAALEIVFRPDPTIWDGRFANNGWLQELPKPLTRLTWDNAALLSPRTAERLHLESQDVIELRYRGRTVRAPVWVQPGHADESVTVHFGYGRTRGGRVANGAGFNAYAIRTSEEPSIGVGLEIQPTGSRYSLACTQDHRAMEGRDIVRVATLAEYQKNPDFVHGKLDEEEPAAAFTLYPGYPYNGYAWGMAVDLNACVGCSACVVACQSENNIAVVGKEQVLMGREMQWIGIDRYYQGDPASPHIYHQPRFCMHCEDAPCELVCPVGATVHSSEGLNEMIYNRCVGTRYCSNNCPYKVRHFNFLLYSDFTTLSLQMMRNPNVTVRSRGVMEKCSYCVQRIQEAKIHAEEEDRKVRDGEIITACQAACPTEALIFGDINDPNSRVAKLKHEPRNYGLLADLNTRPRTTYLGKLRNPNPELEEGTTDERR